MKTINILGTPFAVLTQNEAIDVLEGFLVEPRNHIIVTPNPEGVMQARRNPDFAEALRMADLSLADGIGIILGARILRRKLPGRVRGVDTVFALFERLERLGRPFTAYFLGGKPGEGDAPSVAEMAALRMEARFSHLKVVGIHDGYFSESEEKEIVASINELSPDILLVCMGMPRQELWAAHNRNVNACVTMCLGGAMDIMAGSVALAPPLLRKLGLEWLYRLVRQPSRFKRMLDLPRFVLAVICAAFRRDKVI